MFSKEPEVPIPSFHEASMSRQVLVWRDWPNTTNAQDTMVMRVELCSDDSDGGELIPDASLLLTLRRQA